jgi:hypothetical protein
MGRLIHTGLGSLSLIAHVLHTPHANSFVIGPAVIKHTHRCASRGNSKNEGIFLEW